MSNNKTFSEIDNLLNDIIQKNNFLEKEWNTISQIDLDIIKSEIRRLYQLYYQLETTGEKPEAISQQSTKHEEIKPKSEDDNKETTKSKQQTVTIEEPKEKSEVQTTNIEEQKAESREPIHLTSDLFTGTETVTIAEKFRDNKKSINDKIGINKTDKSIADKLKSKHTDDIKTSIGINEKFLFINELFEGNMQEYNVFIAKLNNLNNLDEAYSFINEQKSIKKWNDNLDSLSKLTDLIENRY
jgi:hypothetical protein